MLRKEKNFSVVEAMKACGTAWNALQEAEKEKYHKMAAKDAERFKAQNEELKEKGYFLLEDGSKSTDHLVKMKRKPSLKQEKQIQTDKIQFVKDLSYSDALRLARSLAPKSAEAPKAGSVMITTSKTTKSPVVKSEKAEPNKEAKAADGKNKPTALTEKSAEKKTSPAK